jgi:hypothetical protein
MFRTQESIIRKTVVYTGMVYVLHASVEAVLQVSSTYKIAHTDARKTYHTIPLYTTVFLKMDPQVLNM